MSKPFAVFDIDGTLIRWQLYHAITDQLARHGQLDAAVYQDIRAARLLWKRRTHEESFREYERQLIKAYDQLLPYLNPIQLMEAAKVVFDEYKDQVYTYTRDLITELKAKGYVLFAISNSQSEIVAKIADYYKFDDYQGAKSDKLIPKNLVLQAFIDKHDITLVHSLAIGDSEGDISMLDMVERPIAFNPTKGLFRHAQDKGWQVVIERKNMIYELEQQHGLYVLAQTNTR